jgi:hypothetical protein
MRWLSLSIAVLAIGCGNNPSPNLDQPSDWLGQQNAGEIGLSGKSCTGPFISDLKPIEHIHSHSTELLLQGKNKPTQKTVDNDTCNELSRYLSASTWTEESHQFANDIRLLIDFGQHTDNMSKSTIRVNSAKLYFLDGSLGENMANVELRCPGSFSLQCSNIDGNSSSCSNYKISYESQTCTFRGDVIRITYANHKRSDLQIFGELSLNSGGNVSMIINKASWMVMF